MINLNSKKTDILDAIRVAGNNLEHSTQRTRLAELLSLLSEEQAESAAKMERQTKTLVHLTWALVALTAGLFCFTVVLYKDTHQMVHRDRITTHGQDQQK